MDKILDYAFAHGPWAIGCLALGYALRWSMLRGDRLQAEQTASLKEGHQSEITLARALDGLGTKVDALGTIINRVAK